MSTELSPPSPDDEKRQRLMGDLMESERQLEEGDYTDYDKEGMRQRFEELKERARGEVSNAGVALVEKQRQALIARVQEAKQQLDRGEYVECDDEGLREYFDGLKERICRKIEEAKQADGRQSPDDPGQ